MRELTTEERSAFQDKADWYERVVLLVVKDLENDGEYDRDPEAAQARADESGQDLLAVAFTDLVAETDLTEGEVRDIWSNGDWG